MNRKPDIIRTIAVIFVVGLVITGFTSMKAPEGGFSEAVNTYVSKAVPTEDARRN